MERVAVLGNAGVGKSMLSRGLAAKLGLPYVELDAILWRPGWQLAPAGAYQSEHSRILAQERWLMDGLGAPESIPPRLARATAVVLLDLPLWIHFWRAAERQMGWAAGQLSHPPAGIPEAPPLRAMFETMGYVDRELMPEIRSLVAEEELRGKRIFRLTSLEEVEGFLSRPDL